jgi:hypothetical protein
MEKLKIVVRGTPRAVAFCPVRARLNRPPQDLAGAVLVDVARDLPVPFQASATPAGTMMHWIVDCLAPQQEKEYVLHESSVKPATSRVELKAAEDHVGVRIGGELFTRYIYGKAVPKPCLYPIVGPFGQAVTRAYPQETVSGDSTDHIHQRSVWVAWGNVNGSDNWSEEPGSGRMLHRAFETLESGPVFGRLSARNDWVSAAGTRLMEDRLEYTFYNVPPSFRLFDLNVSFRATDGDVRFGDTKEGGIISLRVAASMEGSRTGRIENALGAATEAETWGKRASWCDYSGPVGGHIVGIAVFDHPANPCYPTYWHVRDYGLMTANPFGLSFFVGGGADGSYALRAGEELSFRYRVLIHAGGAQEGGVKDKYLEYVFSPAVTVQD